MPELRRVMPELWRLIRPHRVLILFGVLLVLIRSAASLVLPYLSKFLIDQVFTRDKVHLLNSLFIPVFAAVFVEAATSYILARLLPKAAQRLVTDLRERVQEHVSALPISFFDRTSSGVLVSRIMLDVEGLQSLLGDGIIEFLGGIVTAFIAFLILLHVSPSMTLLVVLIILSLGLTLHHRFGVLRSIFRERGKLNGELTGRLAESLSGIRVVKGYNAEAHEARAFATGSHRLLANRFLALDANSILVLSITTALGLVGGLVIFLGGHQVLSHRLTAGEYFQYTAVLAYLIAPVMRIVVVGPQLTEAVAGLDRTVELLNQPREFSGSKPKRKIPVILRTVEFRDVHFAYHEDAPVLHGISFRAEPGTMTALVGSSGSGKSTIASLICGFYTPTGGQVLIDGYDLSTVDLTSYRSQLGVVLQDSFLFDGSIRDNIVFALPNVDENEFLRVCRIARVDEFAERFTDQYATFVGERGVMLSGGQRQRISIARALLANPQLLILDEATSSLDSESEALIQQGLNSLMHGRTTFVIAHRLSTVRKAHQILVIENGVIVERGTHASLYSLRGRYYELSNRQKNMDVVL
jgi:ABC-type multidrug transport system fused ATPase/permease subunit